MSDEKVSLLPCPWCGSSAEMVTAWAVAFARCSNSSCHQRLSMLPENWNRRAPNKQSLPVLLGHEYLTATEHRAVAETYLFDAVNALWPALVADIFCDPYDESLEVVFEPSAPSDLQATEAQAATLLAFGFARFWLNFKDGSEQYGDLLEGALRLRPRRIIPGKAERYASVDERQRAMPYAAQVAGDQGWIDRTRINAAATEIRDLFARYGSGDYVPTESEKEIIELGLDNLLIELIEAEFKLLPAKKRRALSSAPKAR